MGHCKLVAVSPTFFKFLRSHRALQDTGFCGSCFLLRLAHVHSTRFTYGSSLTSSARHRCDLWSAPLSELGTPSLHGTCHYTTCTVLYEELSILGTCALCALEATTSGKTCLIAVKSTCVDTGRRDVERSPTWRSVRSPSLPALSASPQLFTPRDRLPVPLVSGHMSLRSRDICWGCRRVFLEPLLLPIGLHHVFSLS